MRMALHKQSHFVLRSSYDQSEGGGMGVFVGVLLHMGVIVGVLVAVGGGEVLVGVGVEVASMVRLAETEQVKPLSNRKVSVAP